MSDVDDGRRTYTGFLVRPLNVQLFGDAAFLKVPCLPPTRCGPISFLVVGWIKPGEERVAPEEFVRKLRDLIEEYQRNPERFGG